MRHHFKQFIILPLACATLMASCSTLTPVPETSAAVALKQGQYSLDQGHSALWFKVSHFGVSDYMGRFTAIDAQLDFDADNPQATQFSASVDVDSLTVLPPGFDRVLTGADWLDAANYPQANFALSSVSVTGDSTGTAAGTLTLRGISKPVVFDVRFIGGARHPKTGNYAIGFEAVTQFKRSDFGIDNLLSVAGDKFDFDTVTIEFNGEFIKN